MSSRPPIVDLATLRQAIRQQFPHISENELTETNIVRLWRRHRAAKAQASLSQNRTAIPHHPVNQLHLPAGASLFVNLLSDGGAIASSQSMQQRSPLSRLGTIQQRRQFATRNIVARHGNQVVAAPLVSRNA